VFVAIEKHSSGLIPGVIVGLVLALVLLPAALLVWLRWGVVPVAVDDPPLPQEKFLTHMALNARIHREAPAKAPLAADEPTLVAGAHVYQEHCVSCHGLHGHPSSVGGHMYPIAPQLWELHGKDVVGVSDDPPNETFWKVANGIRLTAMPSYRDQLTETEIWQVSLLLSSSDKPLPPPALEILLPAKQR